jgi:hypothetical protein
MSFLAAAPTMGIVGSTGAIGPTLLSSAIAPTAITAATTSVAIPSILSAATPSFFSTIGGAWNAVQPYMSGLSAAGQLLQGVNAIQAGQTQASMYKLQQIQLESKLLNDRLNMTRQANDVLRRLNASNASAVARGYSGGVKGYEGSSALLMSLNDKYAGEDLQVIQENIKTSGTYGDIQNSMLTTAADKAVTGSYFDALASVGKAAYLYSTLKTA